jgi:hypothetical protein
MTNIEKHNIRTEWRQLNLKLSQIHRVIKMNKIIDKDYLNWVNELRKRRDYLTKMID